MFYAYYNGSLKFKHFLPSEKNIINQSIALDFNMKNIKGINVIYF